MSHYAGTGIFCPECFQQRPESCLLKFCTGVGRTAFLIQSSLIDNTQGTVVVAACMNTSDCLWKQGNDVTVASYIIMVGTLSVLGLAAGYKGFCAEGSVAPVGNTMDYQQAHRRML